MVLSRNVLPNDPVPHYYTVSITPDFDTFLFTGHVEIKLTAKNPQRSITLNYEELTFVKVSLKPLCNPSEVEEVPINAIVLNDSEMKAVFPLKRDFVGEAILSIDYTGVINDKLAGFYRSKCVLNGKTSYMGTTQFEAVDARRAIPCWDEPAVKAVFEVIITAPSNMLVLSNMPHCKKEDVGDKSRWFFEPTPKMSTYLLAWTIAELDSIERTIQKTHKNANGETEETLVRIFTPQGKKSQASFALDVACKVLPLYEQFFESNYILPKVDLVAIPDFAAGAMENWGLITYREVALLCDESSSATHRQNVAVVVAHELAHQWFGNLVTMQWWKELWLNESFATYMQYWVIDKLFPEWHVFTQFVHNEITRAFKLDSLRSSHPVEVEVMNAKEIDDIFDAISYSKGGSIVRMTVNFIGEEAFQKGMSAYLRHFAYGNATTEDLWNFLGKAAGKPLTPILEYWTGKQGYPFLTVTLSEDNETLHLTQNRFLATGDVNEEENQTVWKIPLLLTRPENQIVKTVIEKKVSTLSIPSSSWVKVNTGQSAFCRVLYGSQELLHSLLPAIAEKRIPNIDRLCIVSDYHAFARAGYCSAVDVLKILLSYLDEDDYTVWCSIVDFETELRMVISTQGGDVLNAYNAFCRRLYAGAMGKIGFTPKPDDNHSVAQLRGVLFDRLAVAEDEGAIAHAKKLYDERETTPIPADLFYTVFAVHVKKNATTALEEVKMLAATTTKAMERSYYLRALASSNVDGVVTELFKFALSEKVRSQDVIYLLGALASNTEKMKLYAEELRRVWSTLGEKLPGLILGRALKYLEYGADATVADEMDSFWNGLDEKAKMGMSRSYQQGVEGLRNNVVWVTRDAKKVAQFLTGKEC